MRSRPQPRQSGRSVLVWTIPLIAVAFVAGLFLGKPVAAVTGGPEPDPVAEMKKQDARRDSAQIEAMTAQARRIHDGLLPILDGLATTMPPGSSTLGALASKEQVTGWQAVTKGFVAEFAERPSAGTAVNIARSGLATSVQQLDLALAAYARGLDSPDREAWLQTAARQRDIGIVTWSVAATQLDVLNIDSGRGHAHVFLPAKPGQGAMTADGTPEGPR